MSKLRFVSAYTVWRWSCRNACLCSIVLACLTVLCIAVGVGLHHQSDPTKPIKTLELSSDVVYETAQVMVLNMDPHVRSNWWMTAGRFFAVWLVLFLGIQALGKLLGESWQNLRLVWYREHHIVCGLGRIGWQLVQDLIKDGQRVVIIEQDPTNERCYKAERLGAVVLVGDATNDEILKHARLAQAKAVYIVTGSDEKNIEAAVDVQRLTPPSRAARRPEVYVHILEPALNEVLRRSLQIGGTNA